MAKRANLRVKRSSRPSFGSNHDVDRNVVITSSVSSRPSGVPPTTLRPIIFITDAPGVKRDAQRPKKSLKGFRTRQTTDLQSSPSRVPLPSTSLFDFSHQVPLAGALSPFGITSATLQANTQARDDGIDDIASSMAVFRFGSPQSSDKPPANIFRPESLLARQIRELDIHISGLESAHVRGNRDEIVALRRQRNALLPVESLPVELFVDIIDLACQDQSCPSVRADALTSVSQWWKDVILDTPSLWAAVHFEAPSVDNALIYSKAALIDINIMAPHSKQREDLEAFFFKISPHTDRWRSVRFDGRQDFFEMLLKPCLRLPLPLETVNIHTRTPSNLEGVPNMPRLEHLHLTGVTMAWNSIKGLGLKTLALDVIGGGADAPGAAELLNILASLPRLQELRLERILAAAGGNHLSPADQLSSQVTLPFLRSIFIKNSSDHCTASFLESIKAEGLTHLQVEGLQTDECPNLLARALLRHPGQTADIAALRNAKSTVLVAQDHTKLILSFSPGSCRLSIPRGSNSAGETFFEWDLLRRYASYASEVELILNGRTPNLSELDTIPGLTKLEIGSVDGGQSVAEYLCKPLGDGDSLRYPCLKLVHLRFMNWGDMAMLDHLTACRGEVAKRAGGDVPELQVTWKPRW